MTGSARIVRADARSLPLPDDSVDLIVTSPPYYGQRSYHRDGGKHYAGQIGDEPTRDEFLDHLLEVTAECARVLKPTGSLFVNLGDKYATYAGNRSTGRTTLQGATDRSRPAVPRKAGLDGGGQTPAKSLMGIPARYSIRVMDELGLLQRAEIVWAKPNPMPESMDDRVRRDHKHFFHFTRLPRYFADVDPLREQHADTSAHARSRRQRVDARMTSAGAGQTSTHHPLGRPPGSVWRIVTEPLVVPDPIAHAACCAGQKQTSCEDGLDHHAAFPAEWPLRLIQGWCPPGGIVLDPFGGTGTTGLAAKVLGRCGVVVERSADYCRLARWRIDDPGQLRKARAKVHAAGGTTQLTDTDDLGLLGLLAGA